MYYILFRNRNRLKIITEIPSIARLAKKCYINTTYVWYAWHVGAMNLKTENLGFKSTGNAYLPVIDKDIVLLAVEDLEDVIIVGGLVEGEGDPAG